MDPVALQFDFNLLSDIVGAPIAILSSECTVVQANSDFLSLCACGDTSITGRTLNSVFELEHGRLESEVEIACKGHRASTFLRVSGGDYRADLWPIPSNKCAVILRKGDESESERLRELETRVEERTAELAASNKELEAFCYAVSHDLRAPLRSIDGFSYALVQDYGDKLDEDATEFLGRIRNGAKRMDDLITALLSLSRLTTAPLALEIVDISEMAAAVAAELAPESRPEVEIQPGLVVQGDRRMLRAMLDNLIGNAFKFTSKVANPKIRFGRQGVSGPYYVSDNGVGFDMEQATKLFQPFERLHPPREFAGEGVGLATVQRIVRKHGGRIWAEAAPNEGATFYFTLA